MAYVYVPGYGYLPDYIANTVSSVPAATAAPTPVPAASTGQPVPTPVTPMPAQTTQPGTTGFVGPTVTAPAAPVTTPAAPAAPAAPATPVNTPTGKATAIMNADTAATDAYIAAQTAPAKTQAEVDAINAQVKAVTESTGNVYNPANALTVGTQASLNPAVQTTNNFYNNIQKDTSIKDVADAANKDAFALLESIFRSYGLESLVPKIKEYMTQNIGPNQATLLLKQTPEYLARFSGNEARRKAGKNAYDEDTYLKLENRYRELFSAYGQDKYASQTEFSDLIANDVAPTELNDRLDLAVNSVKNADPNILATLKEFYPAITDADLVGYFLKPDQALTDLQQKVTASQIGAAAMEQKLSPLDRARMLQLQGLGVTQETARTGFQKVATVLPESKKLSDIYGEAKIDYTQRVAEEEFLQGTASAARKRKQLQQLESAAFSGSAGTDTTQGSSLAKSVQGKF